MDLKEAKTVFLNRGFVEVNGGIIYDDDKWRDAITVISEWLKAEKVSSSENPNKWIPVSEKLPDIHNYTKQYLVTLDDGTICIDMFTETNGRSWWICENVVAWMPLPEAYKNDIKYYLS